MWTEADSPQCRLDAFESRNGNCRDGVESFQPRRLNIGIVSSSLGRTIAGDIFAEALCTPGWTPLSGWKRKR